MSIHKCMTIKLPIHIAVIFSKTDKTFEQIFISKQYNDLKLYTSSRNYYNFTRGSDKFFSINNIRMA